MEKGYKKELDMCVTEHFAQQRLTQCCKSTILQCKNINSKNCYKATVQSAVRIYNREMDCFGVSKSNSKTEPPNPKGAEEGRVLTCSGAAQAEAQQQRQEDGHALLWGDTGSSVPWTSSSRGPGSSSTPEVPAWVGRSSTR